jgi:hypothetical protein
VAWAQIGKEARCTEIDLQSGDTCICSEPLDANDDPSDSPNNWSDSPAASDCEPLSGANSWGGPVVGMESVATSVPGAETPAAGTNPPSFVQNAGNGEFHGLGAGQNGENPCPVGSERCCTRYYARFADDNDAPCRFNNWKMFTVQGVLAGSFNVVQLGGKDQEAPACDNTPGPPWGKFKVASSVGSNDQSVTSCEVGDCGDCTTGDYEAKCLDSGEDSGFGDWLSWRVEGFTYGPDDCFDNYCRIEACLTTREEGGDLGADDPGPVWTDVWIKPLDDASPEEYHRVFTGDSDWSNGCSGGACQPSYFGVNLLQETTTTPFYVSHIMHASFGTDKDQGAAADSTQRIGASVEFEGPATSGSLTGGSLTGGSLK